MKDIILTEEFEKRYRELLPEIQKKAEKQERFFRQNPFHPSLHTEKLYPKGKEVWSFRVDRRYRIIFRFLNNDKVLFLTIGPHSWIYAVKF